ncbi:MAG: sugar transferase, partial [Actinomycetota bacterium]
MLAAVKGGPATPALRRYLRRKRALDLLLVVVAAPVVLPVTAVLAALIRIDSRGSAIFKQERIGTRYVERDGEVHWEL